MLRELVPHPFYPNPKDPKYADSAFAFLDLPPGYHADYVQKTPECSDGGFKAFISQEMKTPLCERYGMVMEEDMHYIEGAVMLFYNQKLVAWMIFSKCWALDDTMLGVETEYFNFGDPRDPARDEHMKQLIRSVIAFVQARFQVYETDEDTLVEAYDEHYPTPTAVFMLLTVEEEQKERAAVLISMGFKETDRWYVDSDCTFYELPIDVDSSLRGFSPVSGEPAP